MLSRRPVYGAFVSAGGPLATAVVLALLLAVLQVGSQSLAATPVLKASLAFLALLELTALIFNLLPCPGLDGWGIIEPFLPGAVRKMGRRLAYIAPFVLVVALFLVPPLNSIFWDTVFQATLMVGLDQRLAFQGFRLFQFWN